MDKHSWGNWLKIGFSIFRKIIFSGGVIFLFILTFAFTTGPFWIYHWLGTSVSDFHFTPRNIIIMGSSGMPAEQAVYRLYFAAQQAKKYPEAKVFITQPSAENIDLRLSDAYRMQIELQGRGIDSNRIILETKGKNTREEALCVLNVSPLILNQSCVIITSPEHMRRAILTFRKAGFQKVGGVPTFNNVSEAVLEYKDKNLGGRNVPLPEVGNSIQLRYQFWNHLYYQVICYRELTALFWYKLRGWI